ncbi:hypothetical protein FJM67_09995 [Maribrevibacterium harenarium]|uniref:Lipoprotein LPP20-like domain-containing protein n=1 Tax=Maribrevibacterium harenarium TaxID=2589817 RepID=A0A501WPU6_9GAMM|nr:LPP20 family lipoprotein [Maribrevibacterium harenarium]TPE50882.1 hypothetical protein FJM67_09995 [Maribrevibacterium harenarium]
MRHLGKLTIVFGVATLLAACSGGPRPTFDCNSVAPCNDSVVTNSQGGSTMAGRDIEIVDVVPRDPIIVNATGYSAPITSKNMSKPQARLMALRGSKLDAYRNLSERVYGLKIDGTSSLSNLMMQHDELRTYVDAYLVGAKVISQRELEDGTFETVVEMALQENFRQCVSSPSSILSNPGCQIRSGSQNTGVNSSYTSQPSNFYTVE